MFPGWCLPVGTDLAHYEWEVVFSPADVDMMSVRAVFEADGQLLIHVRRRAGAAAEGLPQPQVCAPPPAAL